VFHLAEAANAPARIRQIGASAGSAPFQQRVQRSLRSWPQPTQNGGVVERHDR
jgi:hypothetical protein